MEQQRYRVGAVDLHYCTAGSEQEIDADNVSCSSKKIAIDFYYLSYPALRIWLVVLYVTAAASQPTQKPVNCSSSVAC